MNVIAYFMFESTRKYYLIYSDPDNNSKIYLGHVIEKDGMFEIEGIGKAESFLMKKFIQELINSDLATIKGYQYSNRLNELPDNFNVVGYQEIDLTPDKKASLEAFIKEVNEHNADILEKAKEEYYLQLVDEKEKERRTIIILLLILFACIALIGKMVIDFIGGFS